MKKILSIVMAAALVAFSFTSCKKKGQNEPTPEPTKLVMAGEVVDMLSSYYAFFVNGSTEDGKDTLSLLVYPALSLEMDINDSSVLASATYLKVGKESFELSDIKLTSKLNAAGDILKVTGTFKAGNADYALDMQALVPQALEDADEPFSATFATYTIDDTYLAEYGELIVEAEDATGKYIGLDITLPDGATSLVAGTYTVADTWAASTVYPGSGDSEGYYWSFAAQYDEEGSFASIWYVASGTVTVNADGSINVNCLNTNGKAITATLTAPATSAPARKVAKKAVRR